VQCVTVVMAAAVRWVSEVASRNLDDCDQMRKHLSSPKGILSLIRVHLHLDVLVSLPCLAFCLAILDWKGISRSKRLQGSVVALLASVSISMRIPMLLLMQRSMGRLSETSLWGLGELQEYEALVRRFLGLTSATWFLCLMATSGILCGWVDITEDFGRVVLVPALANFILTTVVATGISKTAAFIPVVRTGKLSDFRLEDLEDAPQQDTVCCICLAECRDCDVISQLPCGHLYHKGCVDQWFAVSAKCPLRCKLESF
jgi:hypothetical protein